MKMSSALTLFIVVSIFTYSERVMARFYISPYFSIKSTKSINPDKKNDGVEGEKIRQRQEMGIIGGISFYNLLKVSLSLGQSKLTTTEKSQYARDEYDEIDFEEDLDMSTDDPDKEIKITETQRVAKLSVVVDPSFWIFILRAKVGVTARQRILDKKEQGMEDTSFTKGPTYKPHSGLGFGVRLTPRMYFMVEYGAYHYKFPDLEPFERELSVNYSVSI